MIAAAIGVVNAGTKIELIPAPKTGAAAIVGITTGYDMQGDYTVSGGRIAMKMDLTFPMTAATATLPVYQLYLQFTDQVSGTIAAPKYDIATCDLTFTTI